jgi:uncharacterized protein (TIGR02246 family)
MHRLCAHIALSLAVLLSARCASTLATRPDALTAVQAFVTAMENADADAIAETFALDATLFMPFAEVPSRYEGREAIRTVFEGFFADVRRSGSPPYMKLQPVDLKVSDLGDVAVITFHLGRRPDPGSTSASTLSRRTFVVRRTVDGWRIQHLHASNLRLEPAS